MKSQQPSNSTSSKGTPTIRQPQKTVTINLGPSQKSSGTTLKSRKNSKQEMFVEVKRAELSANDKANSNLPPKAASSRQSPAQEFCSPCSQDPLAEKVKEAELLKQHVQFLECQLKDQSERYAQLINGCRFAREAELAAKVALTMSELKDEGGHAQARPGEEAPRVYKNEGGGEEAENAKRRAKELERQLEEMQKEREAQAIENKFTIKDQKHQIKELQLQLKHHQNKNLEKQEYLYRQIEDLKHSHERELEDLKLHHRTAMEDLTCREQAKYDQMREVAQSEQRVLTQRVQDLKSQLRMAEMKVMEWEGEKKEHLDNNMDALETIHLRYLEEIRNLNTTLLLFRQEKEIEVSELRQQVRVLEGQVSAGIERERELQCQVERVRREGQEKLGEARRRLDEAYRRLAEHEKCEITIQALKKRMNDLKYRLVKMQQNEKWSVRGLVAKRQQIEHEKTEMKRKMVDQSRDTSSRLRCNMSLTQTLEKKVGNLSQQLANTLREKSQLINKVSDLSTQLENYSTLNQSVQLQGEKSPLERSMSPRQYYGTKVNKSLVAGPHQLSMIEEKLKRSRGKNLFMGKKVESSMMVGYSKLAPEGPPSYCSPDPHESALKFQQYCRVRCGEAANQTLMQSTFVAGGGGKEDTQTFDEEFMSFLASPKVEEVRGKVMATVTDPTIISFQPRSKAVSSYSLRSKTQLENKMSTVQETSSQHLNTEGSGDSPNPAQKLRKKSLCSQKGGGGLSSNPSLRKLHGSPSVSALEKKLKSRNQQKEKREQATRLEQPKIIMSKGAEKGGEEENTVVEQSTVEEAYPGNSSQVPSCSQATARTVCLEVENEKLMNELKAAKTQLAMLQELSSENELKLKKEIANLQYRANFQEMAGKEANQIYTFLSRPGSGKSSRQEYIPYEEANALKAKEYSYSIIFDDEPKRPHAVPKPTPERAVANGRYRDCEDEFDRVDSQVCEGLVVGDEACWDVAIRTTREANLSIMKQ